MQIRELDLKELYTAYDVVAQFYNELSYQEFEDLVYDMRYIEYKMIGIFDNDELVTYAGVSIHTTIKHKRHLAVYELITDTKFEREKYDTLMLEYLQDYAKIGMCENLVLYFNSYDSVEVLKV